MKLEDATALQDFGQFHATTHDFRFLMELSGGKMKRKARDEWFIANESKPVWYVAQGILAAVYGEDPP